LPVTDEQNVPVTSKGFHGSRRGKINLADI
jgi:hypothetical protein